MAFISQLIGKPVTDVEGEPVGKLNDVLAIQIERIPHPQVTAIIVSKRNKNLVIPISDIAVLLAPAIPLNKRLSEIGSYSISESDLYLIRDVLDKQIIDINGLRVVRVNDLELTRINQNYYISNVDISAHGLLRRLGLGKVATRLSHGSKQTSTSGYISWDQVNLLTSDQPMQLKVSRDKLSDLHPADLAQIVSDLTRAESSKFLEGLELKVLADTLEEVEPDFQASLVERMTDEKVADVLEEMAPDEAADLLAELPENRSEDLLNLMETREADDVRRLLTYGEDTAGGIMNTEFVAIPSWLTSEQAIDMLRKTAHEAEMVYYIYVTNAKSSLEGVLSLRQLVLADPQTPINELMETRLITVQTDDTQDDCARLISKYNLLALPVVDVHNIIHGIVTADDALDKILPTAWKKKLPRLYH
jgi:CBS domain-containing protein